MNYKISYEDAARAWDNLTPEDLEDTERTEIEEPFDDWTFEDIE